MIKATIKNGLFTVWLQHGSFANTMLIKPTMTIEDIQTQVNRMDRTLKRMSEKK